MNVAEGKIIGTCYPRHRNEEFLKFLRKVDRKTPKDLDLHLILDNYGTHNHPNVKKWLEKHKKFHFHFTTTGASWLNLVERWFGESLVNAFAEGFSKAFPIWLMQSRNLLG